MCVCVCRPAQSRLTLRSRRRCPANAHPSVAPSVVPHRTPLIEKVPRPPVALAFDLRFAGPNTFQNRSVSSAAPDTTVSPSGDCAR